MNLQKMINNNIREWHKLLFDTLWAYRTSPRGAIGTTACAQTYGHEAVIPIEVIVRSMRAAWKNQLLVYNIEKHG